MSLSRLKQYVLYRLPLLVGLLLLGLWVWAGVRQPVEIGLGARKVDGEAGWRARAAEFISRVHGVWVTPDTLAFLPMNQAPAWYESIDYLPLTFLAVPDGSLVQMPVASTWPDLFYVELAMTPDGVPVDSRRLTNLTCSPAARESLLGRTGTTVALATEILGEVQTVQFLDFAGDRAEPMVRDGVAPLLAGLMVGLDNLQRTGRWEGVHRTELVLTVPVDRVEADLAADRLDLELFRRDERVGSAAISMMAGEVLDGEALFRIEAERGAVLTDPGSWAANWVRDRDWVGADRMAVMEQVAFGLSDRLDRSLYDWLGVTGAPSIWEQARPTTGQAPVPVSRSAREADAEWPPLPLEPSPLFDDVLPGEGEWVVAEPPWLRRLASAPPTFLQTFVRTDSERPYSWVLVVAADQRQLDLRYQQGTVHPRATTGRRGTGEIPRDDETMGRLVAAFNGGFKATHGAFGAVVDGVVFTEPAPRAATIAWTADAGLLFGTWGEASSLPQNVRSMRQNLYPIVADGETNPAGAPRWFAGIDLDPVTERSAVCFRGDHTMMFFWSPRATYGAIAEALRSADCEYGIPLDMNPWHTGFEFYRVTDFSAGEWESARPADAMEFRDDRYLEADDKDFFYLLLRETFERTLPPLGGHSWTGEGMPTTDEGFLPVAAHVRTDGEAVRMVALDATLLRNHFVLGAQEPPPQAAEAYQPGIPRSSATPVVRVGFDAVDGDAPRGLAVDGVTYFSARGTGIWLVAESGRIEVVEAESPVASTRIELWPLDSLEGYGGVCSAVGELADPESVVVTWGNVEDTRRRLQDLGVARAGVLGCGRHVATVESLQPLEAGWSATDVFTGQTRMLETLDGPRSQLVFEVEPRGPRQRRMYMDDRDRVVFEPPRQGYERGPLGSR